MLLGHCLHTLLNFSDRLRAGRSLGITLGFLFCRPRRLLRRLRAGFLLGRLSTGSCCGFGTFLRPVGKEEACSATEDRYSDHHSNGDHPGPVSVPGLHGGIRGRDRQPLLSIPVPLATIRRRIPPSWSLVRTVLRVTHNNPYRGSLCRGIDIGTHRTTRAYQGGWRSALQSTTAAR